MKRSIYKLSCKYAMSLLNQIEREIDVKSWRINDINVWPSLRILIGVIFLKQSNIKKNNSSKANDVRNKIQIIGKLFMAFGSIFKIFLNKDLKNKDVFFLSDGCLECVNGIYNDKYFRSIAESLKRCNLTHVFISPVEITKRPFGTDFISLEKLTIVFMALARIRACFTFKEISLERYDHFIEILKFHKILIADFKKKKILYTAYLIRLYYKFFVWLLKRMNARVVFVVNYYYHIGFAINKACKELGIKSIDIQHGFQNGAHRAYNKWFNISKNGYSELPQVFWVWSQNDACAIEKWAQNTGLAHLVRVTGNISFYFWNTNLQIASAYDEKISNIKKNMTLQSNTIDILVTLQPVFGFRQCWNVLAEVIKNRSLNVRWWLRHHPSVSEKGYETDGLDSLLSIKQENVNFKEATSFPLYCMLRNVQLHMTVNSSVALEAEYFGVPTIFLSTLVNNEFPNLKPEFKHVLEEPQDIVSFIKAFYNGYFEKTIQDLIDLDALILEVIKN